MPSSFMVKRNYAHCPLKKRPLALYNEPNTQEQEEPEDLSVKRPRLSSPPPPEVRIKPSPLPTQHLVARVTPFVPVEPSRPAVVATPAYPSFTPTHPKVPVIHQPAPQYHRVSSAPVPEDYFYTHNHPSVGCPPAVRADPGHGEGAPTSYRVPHHLSTPRQTENLPSLAEYYLELFKATSEAESKKKEEPPHPPPPSSLPWQSPPNTYLPLSPQTSPTATTHHDHPHQPIVPSHAQFYASPMPSYPETSALISPVSTCSESAFSESEDDSHQPAPTAAAPAGTARAARYSCDSCGKSYSTQSGLRKHGELHCASLGGRAFACKHCAKAYTSVGALKMHIRTHTLPCKCDVCGKAFSRPWLLQGHIRTHTGEKPFQCHQCQRSFADRSNLRAHLQTHERVKKYGCHACKKTFSRMSLLNKHSENACMGERLHQQPHESHFQST